jgi:single-stranded DNA-binding protein
MIRVEFKGYVNGVRVFDWGTVYNVSHNQVRKNHQGEWETVGRDYFSVVAPQGAGPFAENDQVEVVGKLKTKTYDKRDGSGKGVSLEVRADEMRIATRTNQPASVPEMQNIWPEVKQVPDTQVPF